MTTFDNNVYPQALDAVKKGDLGAVQRFIEHHQLDPKHQHSELLRVAAEYQYPALVDYLIPLSDPKAQNSLALRWACEKQGVECVELLLPHSDANACNSAALRLAVTYGNYTAAKLLFDVCDPQPALSELLERPGISYGRKNVPETFMQLWDEHKTARLKSKLHDSIDANNQAVAAKKKM